MAIYHPPTIINAYLQDKVSEYFKDNPLDGFEGDFTLPFFPTSPTDINTLTETFPTSNGVFAVYDRMIRMRRNAFPHIKCEQLLYYFYAFGNNSVVQMIEIQSKVEDFLNNGDESAQDINAWFRQKQLSNDPLVRTLSDGTTVPIDKVFFHNTKVYQLQETRDIIDFGTARTYAGNKIIVDFDWHKG